MPKTREEFTKDLKDKELEAKFKNVRNGLKLALSKYMLEPENRDFEKLIESFTGKDKNDPKREKAFIDDLLTLGNGMDMVFKESRDAEDAMLVQKLTTSALAYMDRVSEMCFQMKLDNFPRYKEKFDMGMSEEQEAKAVVPKGIFYSVKLYLDRYYLLFRMYSINVKAKALYMKLADFRGEVIDFEYNIAYNLSRVKGEYIKEITPFKREMKIALLRLRKLFEAIDASNFGKLAKALYSGGIENGVRVYIKYYPEVMIMKPGMGLTCMVSLKSILDNYENSMFPIRQIVADMDSAGYGRGPFKRKPAPGSKDAMKTFWDVADKIKSFREGMHKVIEEMGTGLPSEDGDYKFFIQTVQTVILPYISQTRGEVNDTFIIGVKNLDVFFWKLIIKIIENAQDNGETIDEILGLAIKVNDKEIKAAMAALKDEKDKMADLDDSAENASEG